MIKVETNVRRGDEVFPISGECHEDFQSAVDAFEKNFTEDEDVGAAIAAFRDGELVVDLWGGYADATRTRPWRRDTIVNMMSVGKAFVALAIHMLASRGELDLDAPVATYWPEFAQNGKEDVIVRHVLDHRSGLPVLTEPLTRQSIFNWDEMIGALERQAPLTPPGEVATYHVRTMGFILGEIVARVSGKPFAQFVRDEITTPLGIDYYFGVPDAKLGDCAEFIASRTNTVLDVKNYDPTSLIAMATAQQPLDLDYNSEVWRKAVVPSSNGHGNARAVATVYAMLLNGGEWNGHRFLSPEAIARAVEEQHNLVEGVLKRQYHQAMGFILNSPPVVVLGPRANAFGFHGAGGSLGMADPDSGVALSYATAKMHSRMDNGPRARRVAEALLLSEPV